MATSSQDFVDSGAAEKAPALERRLAALLADIGARLAADFAMRDQINRGIVKVASSLIAEHKSEVSSFIADRVKAWDTGQLVDLIESNVGRDLQYIRFNGALIGGLAGLLLYSAEALIRSAEAFLRECRSGLQKSKRPAGAAPKLTWGFAGPAPEGVAKIRRVAVSHGGGDVLVGHDRITQVFHGDLRP